MPIKNMTPEQIDEATRAQVTAGAKSTDRANRLPGETATEANARINAAYKEITAKPVLSKEQIESGMKVQYVRTQAGGIGEYTAVKPIGYTGPTEVTDWTDGVIPANSKYTTGSRVGLDTGNRTIDEYRKVLVGKLTAGNPLTAAEKAWLDKNGGTSLNPNVTTVAKTPSGSGFETKDGILYANGKPFNGTNGGVDYVNGKATKITDLKGTGTEDDPFTLNGQEFTGILGGRTYQGGKLISATGSSTTKTTSLVKGSGTTITYDANGKPVLTDSNSVSEVTKDAFAALTDLFTSYGLGSLAGEIAGYMEGGYTASEALIKLKTNPTGKYAERFAGNFERTKKGLNALTEAAYVALEDSYAQTLKSYGLGDMLSVNPNDNWKQFSGYIANDLSAEEFKGRISTVEDRVINADPAIKELFKKWYPNLSDRDLISYFLKPDETLPKLKEKVTAAEIGSAFIGQGLATDIQTATGFAQYGVDRAGALEGAANIKSVLPTSEKLSDIYTESGIDYTQKSGESEFLKQNADAAEQRKRLKSLERAKFSGDAGLMTQGRTSLGKDLQGKF